MSKNPYQDDLAGEGDNMKPPHQDGVQLQSLALQKPKMQFNHLLHLINMIVDDECFECYQTQKFM